MLAKEKKNEFVLAEVPSFRPETLALAEVSLRLAIKGKCSKNKETYGSMGKRSAKCKSTAEKVLSGELGTVKKNGLLAKLY